MLLFDTGRGGCDDAFWDVLEMEDPVTLNLKVAVEVEVVVGKEDEEDPAEVEEGVDSFFFGTIVSLRTGCLLHFDQYCTG